MPIVQGIDGSMLLNAFRQGHEDRAAVQDRALQRMYQQRQMDQQDRIIAREDKAQAKSDATDAAYAKIFGVDTAEPAQTAPTGAPDAPVVAGATVAPTASSSATGLPQINPTALRALMATGPTGIAAAQSIMKMNAEQLKTAQEAASKAADIKASSINAIRAYPPEQREAQWQAQKAELAQQGIPTAQLAPHWDETMADSLVQQSLTALEALGLKDKAATFAETVRHNKVSEDNAAGNLSVAKGNLGVAQGRLGVSRETLEAAKAGKIGVLPGNEDLAGYR